MYICTYGEDTHTERTHIRKTHTQGMENIYTSRHTHGMVIHKERTHKRKHIHKARRTYTRETYALNSHTHRGDIHTEGHTLGNI